MDFLRRAERKGRALALLPGAWNPPTRAHAALAAAALKYAEEAVFVIPRAFPHKEFDGPPASVRVEWIERLSREAPGFSAAVSEGGLFLEMAREARAHGAERVFIVCGNDAAERIATWPYPPGKEFERQIETEYELLVAPRQFESGKGLWTPPEHLDSRIHTLPLEAELQTISSTRIRELIRSGGEWRTFVPKAIADDLARAYGCS